MKKCLILLLLAAIAAMLIVPVSAEVICDEYIEVSGDIIDYDGDESFFVGSGGIVVAGDGTHIIITGPGGSENAVEIDGDRVTAAGAGDFDISISPEMKEDISRILEDGVDNLDKDKINSFIGKYGEEIIAEYGAGVMNDIIDNLDYDTVDRMLSKVGINLSLIVGAVIGAIVFVALLIIAVIVLTIVLISTRKKMKKLKASAETSACGGTAEEAALFCSNCGTKLR